MLTYQGSYSFNNNFYVCIFKNLSFSSLICQLTSFLSFHFTLLVLPECLSSLCASVASVLSIDGVFRDASGVSKILLVVLFARIESSRMLFPFAKSISSLCSLVDAPSLSCARAHGRSLRAFCLLGETFFTLFPLIDSSLLPLASL